MNTHTDRWRLLLEKVQEGQLSIEQALGELRDLPFEDLGFARVDHHRALRRGFSEVVFCQGKTPEQAARITQVLAARSPRVLATRCAPETAAAIRELLPHAEYHELARCVLVCDPPLPEPSPDQPLILVISAGTSDLPVAEEAVLTARAMGSRVEMLTDVGVAGLHRILSVRGKLQEAKVIVVVAGMEGALPTVVGGLVNCPVIAVPTSIGYGAAFGGLAALLGMLNSCVPGVVVVNIDNGFGAGYAAHLMLAAAGSLPTPSPQRDSEPASQATTPPEGALRADPPTEVTTAPAAAREEPGLELRALTMLETNVDNMDPEFYDYVLSRCLAAGALDVTLHPMQMKKNRPATLLRVLCAPELMPALRDLLLRETTTLGVRVEEVQRYALPRQSVTVATSWGQVRVKVAELPDGERRPMPEYEDCRRLAEQSGAPLWKIYQAAQALASNDTKMKTSEF